MLKKIIAGLALLLWLNTETVAAQDSTSFRLTPKAPEAGETATVDYNPAHTVLKNSSRVRGIVYWFDSTHFRWHADDMPMTRSDSGWQGKYRLAKDAAFLNWVFTNDSTTDKGGRWTYTVLGSRNGRVLPGAYFAWGSLRSPFFVGQNPYKADSAAYIETNVMRYWIQNELRNNPGSYLKMIVPLFSFYRFRDTSAEVAPNIRKSLAEILNRSDLPEQGWVDAITVYENVLHDQKAADSVKALSLAKFTTGILARDAAIEAYMRQQSTLKDTGRIRAFAELLERFPPQQFQQVYTRTSSLYYDKLFRTLVYTPIMKDSNYANLYKYLPVVPTAELPTFYHHLVEIPNQQKQMPVKTLLPLSQLLIAEMMKRKPTEPQSPLEWQAQYVSQNYYIIYTHALLLYESGQFAAALPFAETLQQKQQYKNANLNDLYIRLLQRTGNTSRIAAALRNSIRNNAASPAMLDLLKEDYKITNKGNEAGFEQYLASLKSDQLGQQQKDIEKEMVNLPIAPFKLTSAKGGIADLAKLRGKVVVLDLWATWCAPCKAAMPGMKLVVDKYKNVSDVAFFFIATLETKPDYKQQIKAFIEQQQYPFEVLYDGKNFATGQLDDTYSKYAKAFHFSGIPQKMIIDKKGRLRWRSTGYYGSPSALADEISYVVDLLKAE